jgi:hypothetical protein
MNNPQHSSRRTFLKQSAVVSAAALLPACTQTAAESASGAPHVAIVWNPADPVAASDPAQWAMQFLAQAFHDRGISAAINNETPKGSRLTILASGPNNGAVASPAPESLTIVSHRESIRTSAADPRGLAYALTELADRVRLSPNPLADLQKSQNLHEQPANSVRSVMRLFVSSVEDPAWFHDRDFWSRYLDLLASSRFNRFNLALGLGYDNNHGLKDTYFFFAYPFLVSPQGYNVRATGVSDDEREKNLASLRFISDQTARRGLHFQLGLWTHAYTAIASPNPNHTITGLTDQTHPPYCRDALHLLLEQCPSISGVTFRVHGESGIPEGSYGLWKTVFDGLLNHGDRRIRLDMHAKGMNQEMIDTALSTKLPVTLSPKFWAEHLGLPYHQAAIREQEMPRGRPVTGQFALSSGSRSFLRYGYGDLLKKDRPYQITHRIWPGSNRFLLTADPLFAAAYGRCLSFARTDGFEIFDPLSFKGRQASGQPGHRTAYTDASHLQPAYDHEKFLLTYRTWGRLGYNPDSPADVCERGYRAEFGASDHPAATALASASRILPLTISAHLPSAANLSYWPEIYTNMSLVDPSHPGSYTDTPTPRTFLHVSPLDPQLFSSISEHVDALLAGKPLAKISPAEVAAQLMTWGNQAAVKLPKAGASGKPSPALSRAALDANILGLTGKFFAHKLLAGLLFAYFQKTADPDAKRQSLDSYRTARNAWAAIIKQAGNSYVPDIAFGPTAHLRGHWSDRLPAIDADIAAVEAATAPASQTPPANQPAQSTMHPAIKTRAHMTATAYHKPAATFTPGLELPLTITPREETHAVRLWYRHADQAERWSSLDMHPQGPGFTASIPAAYTQTDFPLQYYFETQGPQEPRLFPGFGKDFLGQPYFLLLPA